GANILAPGRPHDGDTADAGVAGIEIALAVEHEVAGFRKMAGADAHAVADGAHHLAGPVQLEELAVLAAAHPGIALGIEMDGADQVAHLQGAQELAVAAIDHDAILLAVADPDIAIAGIDGQAMGGV